MSFMEPRDLILRARKQNRSFLTEAESKIFLSGYGVPVVEESIAKSEELAVEISESTGFPVVLKALGSNLIHKTERSLVRLNLQSSAEALNAFRTLKEKAGDDWEGCLVQPFMEGKREFIAGMLRDPQMGPVVMFGLGGIFTEAIGDVAFRIAPLELADVQGMIDELSSRPLLSDFRGESAVDMEQLTRVLMGLSRLGMEHPDILEVDINPLIISADGRVTAVDALIHIYDMGDKEDGGNLFSNEEYPARMDSINLALDSMFHPKAIAIIGAGRPKKHSFGDLFYRIIQFGFPGKIYPVNPNVDEIYGYKAYPDVASIPEPVDLVIVSVPARSVPKVLEDCIASGNKNIHIFSSGFNETGETEGARLYEKIRKIAVEGGLNVIGPNCMGIYVPESKIVTWALASEESGPIAFLSQSGGNSRDFAKCINSRFGLNSSKVVSYGNALTLEASDFLDYLSKDDETRIICLYLEGVRDGRKLLRLVKKINKIKPVVIMKAGLTGSGARAVASHTGSLAGGERIWNAFFKQSGAVRANSLEEMAEVALALLNTKESYGKGVAVVGSGGGVAVSAADECSKAGLDLVDLPPEILSQLREFIPSAGTMTKNPVDAHLTFFNLDLLGQTLDILSESSAIDMFILTLSLDWLYSDTDGDIDYIENIASYMANEAIKHVKGKPMVVSWRQYEKTPDARKLLANVEQIILGAGIPFYEGLTRTASVLSKVAQYHEFRRLNK